MGPAAPVELRLARAVLPVIIVDGDVEAQAGSVRGIRQGGFLDLELNLIALAGRACGGKPVTLLSELWIVGLVIAPGIVGAQNVLAFKPFGSTISYSKEARLNPPSPPRSPVIIPERLRCKVWLR